MFETHVQSWVLKNVVNIEGERQEDSHYRPGNARAQSYRWQGARRQDVRPVAEGCT